MTEIKEYIRTFTGLMATSANRAYLASVLRTFAQVLPYGRTSDTLGTLYDITSMGK